jgi:hypothetical protein
MDKKPIRPVREADYGAREEWHHRCFQERNASVWGGIEIKNRTEIPAELLMSLTDAEGAAE